jgi:tripartite-type tricarboxylate transporter receptor subunit TctC
MKLVASSYVLGVLLLALTGANPGLAQTFPDKPVKLVVPYQPGGATDTIARALGQQLSEKWKQPVIIVNRPGASATLGANYVAKSEPDGYTLLICDSSVYVVVPHLLALPYDPHKDLAPITIVARQPPVLTTRTSLPVLNTKELLNYIRAHPGEVTYGSFGVGTWAHVAMEEVSKIANLKMLHVPYRGGAEVLTDMLAGRVDIFFATMGAVRQYKEAGTLKVLATATANRLSSQPDLPTMSEDGLPGYSLSVWFGLVAPANTPPVILDKIRQDIADLNTDPNFREKVLGPLALEPGGETRQEFSRTLNDEFDRWGSVIKQIGISGFKTP